MNDTTPNEAVLDNAQRAEGPPGQAVNDHRQLTLTGQQHALIRALEQRNSALAIIYRGGLWVLADSSNPDRLSLCAHAMRELMEKLPEYLDVSTQAQRESLKVKVREVEDFFITMKKKTDCFNGSTGWNGTIDGPLRNFLLRFSKFVEWFARHYPRRRAELNDTLVRLDVSRRALPAPLALLNVDAWDKKRDYFQAIAHHRKVAEEADFLQWLEALERFLLERLMPRTFDDFADIDALLREEDSNA